jgi:hypothetical protein
VIVSAQWFPESAKGVSYFETMVGNLYKGFQTDCRDDEDEKSDDDAKPEVGHSGRENVVGFHRKGDAHAKEG